MRLWHIIVFLVVLVGSSVVLAPAAIFAPQRPGIWTYARAEGNAWGARFSQARLGSLQLGQVDWTLEPLPLTSGALRAKLSLSGGDVRGDIVMRVASNARRIQTDSLRIEGVLSPTGTPMAGMLLLRDLDITFENGLCTSATGTAESDILARNAAVLGFTGPPLRGVAHCAGESAIIPLSEPTGAIQVEIALRQAGDAAWRVSKKSASSGGAVDASEIPMEITGGLRWLPF